ncbi:hypothetical protein A0H81_06804 [Grifola frondosa]|uniref:Uncharacterized protein n=1 Tax=Grifola frondosa TaxID=5627 RepID=A0A1C7M965_GRIFR|nr:hypothetical protein A0H81_06804 [Grifola frondosa]
MKLRANPNDTSISASMSLHYLPASGLGKPWELQTPDRVSPPPAINPLQWRVRFPRTPRAPPTPRTHEFPVWAHVLPVSPSLHPPPFVLPSTRSPDMRIPPLFTCLALTLTLTLDLPLTDAAALARLPLALGLSSPAASVPRIPEDWTNAQRLAARLPPRAPQNLRRTPTRRAAPSASPSPRLLVKREGRIEVRDAQTSAHIGFVSSSGSAGLSADADALRVRFATAGAELVDLEAADAAASSARRASLMGVCAQRDRPRTRGTEWVLSFRVRIEITDVRVFPAAPAHARGTGQSRIWTFDARSLALTPHWVGPDGAHVRVHAVYNGTLFLVRDGDAQVQAQDVGLYFVGG